MENLKLMSAVAAFDERLTQWAQAYPAEMFPTPDFAEVERVLSAAGLSLSCVSAANMRHVVTKLDELFAPVRAAVESMSDEG